MKALILSLLALAVGSIFAWSAPAAAQPNLALSSTSLDFGNVLAGENASQTLTLANTGTEPLSIFTLGLADPLDVPFTLVQDGCSNQVLSPSAICTVTVRFAPTAVGSQSDSFDVFTDDPDNPSVRIAVRGTGLAVQTPSISLSPTSLSFGSVTVGQSVDQTLTVTNTGSASVSLTGLGLADPPAAPFYFLQDGCSGQVLSPQTSCTAVLRFIPPAAGSYEDSFDVASDDPSSPSISVGLRGTGEPAPAPRLSVSPSSLLFGDVTAGKFADRALTLTNTGDAPLSVFVLGLINSLDPPFTFLQDGCTDQVLDPSTSCTTVVRFEPSAVGSYVDSFDIFTDDPEMPIVTLDVSGNLTPSPELTVSASIFPFGSVMLGELAEQTLTLTNSGTAPLSVAALGSLDPLGAPFSLEQDGCSNQVLSPQTSCTVVLRFEPSVIGPAAETFDVPTDDPDTPSVTVSVSGTGDPVPVPDVFVSSTSLDFGNLILGEQSDQTLTLTNTGTADLSIATLAAANPLGAPFELVPGQDGCSNQVLTPSSSCTVQVRFAPTALGLQSDSFDIPSDDPDSPNVTVTVSGTGDPVPVPDLVVSSTSLDFGTVTLGEQTDQTLTVTNAGTADLSLAVLAAANPLGAPFELVPGQDGCSNQVLTPSTSCTVQVRFAPTALGIDNDSFDIPSDDPDSPNVTVTVSGTGDPVPVPDLLVSPTNLDFGTVTLGEQADQTLTLTNTGTADLSLAVLAAANPLGAPFSLVPGQDGCSNQVLTPSTSCTVQVRFAPTALGIDNDSFDIPSDDPDSPSVTVTVSGAGDPVPVPDLLVSPTNLDFGTVTLGEQADQTLTLTNTGTADLSLAVLAAANPLGAPFELVPGQDGCSNQVLTPSSSCTVQVRFAPTALGLQSDSFDIPSDDPDSSSVTVNVSGTGDPVPVPDLVVSSTNLDFGTVTLGEQTDQTLTVTNAGTADLSLAVLAAANPLGAPFSLVAGQNGCSNQVLTPSTSCTVQVRFAPTALGLQSDSFDIPSDDPDSPNVTVTVSGTGDPVPVPDLVVSSTNLDFGTVTLGEQTDQTLTVTNAGTADLSLAVLAAANPLGAPFSLVPGQDGCSNQVLTPSTSCTVQVRFAPTALGIDNDSFDIPSDDPDSPNVTVTVSGTGDPVPVPDLLVSSTSLDFGTVTLGEQADQTLTLTNTGTASLTVFVLGSGNSLDAPFSFEQDGCSDQVLSPQTSCTVVLGFVPSEIGLANESFDVSSDDPDTPTVTINLSGTGDPLPTPSLSVSSTTLSFGSVTIGEFFERALTLTNTGTASLTISALGSSNPLDLPFTIEQDGCSNQVLTPQTSCTVLLHFSPSTTGLQNESFDVPSDDPDSPSVTINVNGTGDPAPTPNLVLSTTRLSFGSVAVGDFAEKTLTVANTGTAPLSIFDLGFDNPLDAPFTIEQDGCSNQALSPSTYCRVVLRFAPDAAALWNESFDLPTNDPDVPNITINVDGTGELALMSKLSVSSDSFVFGSVTVGEFAEQTLTLTNAGTAPLSIFDLGFDNPLEPPFTIEQDACSNQVLSSQTSCAVLLRFSPSALGAANESFDISSDDSDQPSVTINVSGTGEPAPIPNLLLSSTSFSFGSVTLGDSVEQTLTLVNSGTAPLWIFGVGSTNALEAPFALDLDGCSGRLLSPSGSCTVVVRFAPTAAGTTNESFNVSSNDPDNPGVTVNVSGTGEPLPMPKLSVSSESLAYGSVLVGELAEQTLTLTNAGTAPLSIFGLGTVNLLDAPFAFEQDACSGQQLEPSMSCTAVVSFVPSEAGPLNESFDVSSDDPDRPTVTVNVSGTGQSNSGGTPAVLAFSPSLWFGTVPAGQTAEQTLMVANLGAGTLIFSGVGSSDPLQSPFAIVSDSCGGQALNLGEFCTVVVSFTPTSSGPLQGDTFDLSSNDPVKPMITIYVSGAGG